MLKTINELGVERDNFRYALQCLLDEYVQYVDDACHCESNEDEDEDDGEQLCPYCYAKHMLKESY